MHALIVALILIFSAPAVVAESPQAAPPAVKEKFLKKAGNFKSMMQTRVVRTIPLPKGYHEGLFIKDNSILVINGNGGKTWEVDISSGKVISEIKPMGTFTEAITAAPSGKYWVSDWDAKKIYLARIKSGVMIPESEISLAPEHPAGVEWNGSNLFVLTWDRSIAGTKYYLLKMDEKGAVLERVRIMQIREPSQMTWDGRYLWVSSWFDRRVFKVDCGTWEVLGYFRTHVERTTGIAWDGSCFWLTGTEAGLRRIEVIDN